MENKTLLDYYISSGNQSDKGTHHNYIQEVYTHEFSSRQESETNILEIGVRFGWSIKLWREWFKIGNVYGIDTLYTIESQLNFVKLYLPKLKKGGRLIIEDILEWRKVESKFKKLGEDLKLEYEGQYIAGSRKSDNAMVIYTK
jgi:hypothetical protein